MATSIHDLELPFISSNLIDRAEAERLGAEALAISPIAKMELGYTALSHEWITKVLRERRFHHILRLIGPMRELDPRLVDDRRQSILSAEGDEHQRLRRLVSPAFTPKAAERLRPFMAATMNQLVDAIVDQGHCDVIADICEPYPIPIICELLGAPAEDWEDFSRWATDVLAGLDRDANEKVDRILAGRHALDEYVIKLIERRRTDPADDLITVLIQAEEEGDRLTELELITMVEAVLVAGVDTTRNQLGCAIAMLAEHPEMWKQLADEPDIAAKAVEEIMRHLGAVRGTARYASEDIVIDDILFPKGTVVAASFVAGNHDDAAYTDPAELGFDKPAGGPPQLTFGSGIHFCLGASLARAELQEALKILAKRLPDLALAGPVTWKSPAVAIWGPDDLHVTFTPPSR